MAFYCCGHTQALTGYQTVLKISKLAGFKPTQNDSHKLSEEEDPQVSNCKEPLQRMLIAKMALAAGSLVAQFGVMSKDVPIKMTSITQLVCDGSNYQHWELEFLCM